MNLKKLKSIVGDGKMVTVTFLRADGKKRVINGRTGVGKYSKGKRKVDFDKQNVLNIWETIRPQDSRDGLEKRYRSIKPDRVLEIRAGGLVIRAA